MRRRATGAVVGLLLAACSGTRAPVADSDHAHRSRVARQEAAHGQEPSAADTDARPTTYTVRRGDTLYGIALDAGLDYHDVAVWNKLADVNRILVGQRIRLVPPSSAPLGSMAPLAPGPAAIPAAPTVQPLPAQPQFGGSPVAAASVRREPKAVRVPYSDEALARLSTSPVAPATDAVSALPSRSTPTPTPTPGSAAPFPAGPPTAVAAAPSAPGSPMGVVEWSWPVSGPLLRAFGTGSNPKGIVIGGQAGQAVGAAASGRVVYSGTGLRGYGPLLILRHNPTYLSVYANNRALLVKEGDMVRRGQPVAEMGEVEPGHPSLHFELRRLGKPVDPVSILPGS